MFLNNGNKIISFLKNVYAFLKQNVHYFVYIFFILLIIYPIFLKSGHIFLIDFYQGVSRRIYIDNSFDIILKFISYLLPVTMVSRIFIVFVLSLICLGAKSIVSVFTKNKVIISFLPLFTLINPFTYDRFGNGQFYILLGFAFTMFSVAYLLKYFLNINNDKVFFKIINKNFFLFSLFFALSTIVSLHFIFLTGIFYLIFLFFYFVKNKFSRKSFFEFLLLNVTLFLLIFVANINMFVSIVFMNNNVVNYVKDIVSINVNQYYTVNGIFVTFGSNLIQALFYNLNNSGMFTENGVNYKSLNLEYNSVVLVSAFSVIFILFVFGIRQAIIKYKKNSYVFLSLMFVFLLSLVLSFGNSFCFNKLANFNYSHIPFFNGMREATKFNLDMCIIYLIFISIAVDWIFNKIKTQKIQYLTASALVLIFCLRAPFLLFGFWGQFKIYDYPNDWYRTDSYLKDELKCDGKMLFLPFEDYIRLNIYETDRAGMIYNFMNRFFSCDVVTGVSSAAFSNISENRYRMIVDIKNSLSTQYSGIIRSNWFDFIGKLKKYNIKYIILSKSVSYYFPYEAVMKKNINVFELLRDTKYFMIYKLNY